ncbi:pE family protein [Mycobacterium kansasii 824]|nr:pE family protein [Mycobacterium kansasii 824]
MASVALRACSAGRGGGAGGLGDGGMLGTGGAGGRGGLLWGNAGISGPGLDGRTVPLTMHAVTEPVVFMSVNGGPNVPILVDTGSAGLVVTPNEVGGLFGLFRMGLPTNFGLSGYSGGLTYLYATYHAPVDFGNGIATPPTNVNVVLLSFPQTFSGYFAPAGVNGVLGIGPNATGPVPAFRTRRCRATSIRVCSSTSPRARCGSVPIRWSAETPLPDRRSRHWVSESTAARCSTFR